MGEQRQGVTDGDLESLREKLTRFCATLTPAEYAALGAVVERAAAAVADTRGHGGFGEIKIDLPSPSIGPPPPAPAFKLPDMITFVARDLLGPARPSTS